MALMFMGEYEHSLDERGRLAIPARYRGKLGDTLVVTLSRERCLTAFPVETWERLAEEMSKLPMLTTADDYPDFVSFMFARAADLEIDKQGRILIPSSLREYAAIKDNVFIVGKNTCFEIWDRDLWLAKRSKLEQEGSAIAKRLGEMGLSI